MNPILDVERLSGPLGSVVNFIDQSIRLFCAITLLITFLAMFLPTLANAVLRYATNASLVWSVEIVQLTFPWFIMAGAVLAAQHQRHIGVEFFINLLPQQIAKMIAILVQVLIVFAAITVGFVYLGFGVFDGGMQFAAGSSMFTSLGVSQVWSYLAILVGYSLLGLTALTSLYRILTDQELYIDPTASSAS